MRFHDMPFDTQTCSFTIGLYTNTDAEVILAWHPDRDAFGNWRKACQLLWEALERDGKLLP